MAFLCKRCYINSHDLTKKEIKQLNVTDQSFVCDNCKALKKLVIVRKVDEEGVIYEDIRE